MLLFIRNFKFNFLKSQVIHLDLQALMDKTFQICNQVGLAGQDRMQSIENVRRRDILDYV